jgi:RHS repeat-associated protein
MGRLQKVTDLAAQSDIISNATYNPAGQLLTMTGNTAAGVTETRTYNSIGQLTNLTSCPNWYGCTQSLNIQYNYPATGNNGKITSQYDALSGETVAYAYDSLNRLASATSSVNPGWGQSYAYDGFGNLTNQTVTKGTAPTLSVSYDPATNRRTGGECADANGNLNAQSSTSPCTSGYGYDIENRIVMQNPVWLGVTPTVAYSYKPGNKRIWRGTGYVYDGVTFKSLPANEELTFWSITGQKLVTYSVTQYQPGGINTLPQLVATSTGTNQYFGGKLIKNAGGYVTPDRLGSIGKYFPYGQERPSATTDGKEKFATYFRDGETGLDYADQRYHQPGMGRFMTPDSMTGKAPDPETWNKYAYAGGDPVGRKDPGGTDFCDVDFSVGVIFSPSGYPCSDPNVNGIANIWIAILTASVQGGDICAAASAYAGTIPGCGGTGAGEQPPPQQPECTIEVFNRPLEQLHGLNIPGAQHGYIVFEEANGNVDYFEGQNINWTVKASGPTTPYPRLTADVQTNNHFDGGKTGPEVCDWLTTLNQDVNNVNNAPSIPYYAFGPNSSSVLGYFLSTLPDYKSWVKMPWMIGFGSRLPGVN